MTHRYRTVGAAAKPSPQRLSGLCRGLSARRGDGGVRPEEGVLSVTVDEFSETWSAAPLHLHRGSNDPCHPPVFAMSNQASTQPSSSTSTPPTTGSTGAAVSPAPLSCVGPNIRPSSMEILDALGRVGAAAPEHLLAMLRRCHPDALPLNDVLLEEGRLAKMAKAGLVDLRYVTNTDSSLAVYDCEVVWLTDAGRRRAAQSKDARAMQLRRIAALSPDLVTPSGVEWIFFERLHATVMSHWAEAKHVRAWLRECERHGLLRLHRTRPDRLVPAASLIKEGREWLDERMPGALDGVPQLRRPAEYVMTHHLQAVRSAVWMISAHSPHPDPLYLEGDSDLRAQGQRGHRSKRRQHHEPVADVRLHVQVATKPVVWDAEVIGAYTAAQIHAKYRSLQPGTVYFATNDSVADRVAQLGHPRPRVI